MRNRSKSQTRPRLSRRVKWAAILAATLVAGGGYATAQHHRAIPAAITTPDKVETRIGTLDFKDGMPSKAAIDKIFTKHRRLMEKLAK